jgi:hypothetical protein
MVLVGNPVINKQFGRPRIGLEINIKMDFRKRDVGYGLDQAG